MRGSSLIVDAWDRAGEDHAGTGGRGCHAIGAGCIARDRDLGTRPAIIELPMADTMLAHIPFGMQRALRVLGGISPNSETQV